MTQRLRGGSASVESVSNVVDTGLSSFISEEVAESERPELNAGVIISGGRGMRMVITSACQTGSLTVRCSDWCFSAVVTRVLSPMICK